LTLSARSCAGGLYSETGVTSGSFNPTTAGVGTYSLSYAYTDSNGCSGSASDTMHVLACVGINENAISAINIYPNPANNNININLSSIKQDKIVITLFDVTGKMVMNQQVNGGTITALDVTNLSTGIYYITVQTNDNLFKNKISINK